MYIIKNAWTNIIRGKGRNILIGFIIVAVTVSTCIAITINKSATKLVNKYKNTGYIVVFIGDSPSDLNAAGRANICATTDNCFEYIKSFFHYVSKYQGGHGGFADILYQLMLMDKDDLEIYK